MNRYIIILVLVFVTHRADAKAKTRILSLEQCKKPDNKWDKDNMPDASWSTNRVSRQTTLIYGHLGIKNKFGPVTVALRTYILKQDSSRDLVFNIDQVSCKKPLVTQLLKSLSLVVDNDCNFLPCSVNFTGVNVDDYSWLLTNVASTPGKYAFVVEFNTEKGHIMCMDIIVNINYTK